MSQLVFSLVHLSHEWYGWAKYTLIPVSNSIILCSANSLPLSKVRVFRLFCGRYFQKDDSVSVTHCACFHLLSWYILRYPLFRSTIVRIAPLLSFQITVSHSQSPIRFLSLTIFGRSSIIRLSCIWYLSGFSNCSFFLFLYFFHFLLKYFFTRSGWWLYIQSYIVSLERYSPVFLCHNPAICSGENLFFILERAYFSRSPYGSILECCWVLLLFVLNRSEIINDAENVFLWYFWKRREIIDLSLLMYMVIWVSL